MQHLHVIMPYATYTTAVPQPRERSPLDEALARDDATALATIAPRGLERTLIAAIHASAYRCVTSLLAAGPIALDGAITAAAVDQSDPWR